MKVLVIEDDPEFCEILVRSLSTWGHFPAAVFNWFSVMRVLATDRFDLIVTDIETPTGNALNALDFLNQDDRIRAIPKIVISGQSGQDVDRACLVIGAKYIRKSPRCVADLKFEMDAMNFVT